MRSTLFLSALCLSLISMPGVARADCDSNVITGLDISSSINAQETMLQIDGMAQAISSPSVVAAIQNGERGCINFAVFVWADGDYPALVAWMPVASQADADRAAAEIRASLEELLASAAKGVGVLTNLSGALEHAGRLLDSAPPAARLLVNIAGNGEDNVGEGPPRARDALLARGVTINGVVIGGNPAVLNHYRTQVIGGEFARVWIANSPEDVAYTFALKFVNEIAQVMP